MSLPTQQELLEKAQGFDQDALAAIYDRFSPGIYRYAMRLTGDDCLSEDLVSETFSRFLKVLKAGLGPRDHLQAYLYRIMHNLITDSYRRQVPPPLELDESLPDGDHQHPELQVERRMKENRVRLALRSLTPDQRQVITLRFIEGWENEEVAAALQKPVGAIKALQHRAVNALRRWLVANEVEGINEEER
jgi:RNA polymerase sigma-70 factor (ECF subfamily)